MANWLDIVVVTILGLLPITNPLSTAAFFLSITAGDTKEYRNEQALRGVIYTFFILLTFLLAGSVIMTFFGITIPGIRIAGGIMLLRVAMGMMNSDYSKVSEKGAQEAKKKSDISFTPLAMPSLSGPGAIAVTIGMAAKTERWYDYTAVIVGIFIVVLIAYIALRSSERIIKVVGENGILALSKIMGFLLLCVGIQFLINGIVGVITQHALIEKIVEVLREVS